MGPGPGTTTLHTKRGTAALLLVVSACTSMPFGGNRSADQLTAAITDVREATEDRLILSSERLAPFRTAADGASEPEVRSQGEHDPGWVDALVGQGLVDEACAAGAGCRPQAGALLVRLSRPYDGRTGAFVDATIQSVLGNEGASVVQTRFVRFQIEEEPSGWRVVASTPLWESVGPTP
ncbi:MAG: hypothetical protein HKN73_14300 [Gemmatimonadetes bacterium]|nr:hypothetical protein [Gemmatimonadota bacterium]